MAAACSHPTSMACTLGNMANANQFKCPQWIPVLLSWRSPQMKQCTPRCIVLARHAGTQTMTFVRAYNHPAWNWSNSQYYRSLLVSSRIILTTGDTDPAMRETFEHSTESGSTPWTGIHYPGAQLSRGGPGARSPPGLTLPNTTARCM